MVAIAAGMNDVVVVYKLDRISRSMLHITLMMAFVDQYEVWLVSVSQHLNSGDSLGRLAINTLISFTEFERDIASERTRNKFYSTRRRGLWSGSVPPLGYELEGQRLVIKKNEAYPCCSMCSRCKALRTSTTRCQSADPIQGRSRPQQETP